MKDFLFDVPFQDRAPLHELKLGVQELEEGGEASAAGTGGCPPTAACVQLFGQFPPSF